MGLLDICPRSHNINICAGQQDMLPNCFQLGDPHRDCVEFNAPGVSQESSPAGCQVQGNVIHTGSTIIAHLWLQWEPNCPLVQCIWWICTSGKFFTLRYQIIRHVVGVHQGVKEVYRRTWLVAMDSAGPVPIIDVYAPKDILCLGKVTPVEKFLSWALKILQILKQRWWDKIYI